MQTLFGVNELAQRWGYDPSTIRQMERDGKLHRLPDIPGVKFSVAEVHQLESIGKDAEAMSPWERKQKDDRIRELEAKVADLTQRLAKITLLSQGVE